MEKTLRRLSYAMALISSAALLIVMGVMFIDVIGRYFLGKPLTFSVEAVKLGMGLVITYGLALTTLRGGHISVDLLSRQIVGRWVDLLFRMISALTAAVFMGLIGWRVFERAVQIHKDGLRTEVMDVPVFPVVYLMAVAGAVATAVALFLLFRPDITAGNSTEAEAAMEQASTLDKSGKD